MKIVRNLSLAVSLGLMASLSFADCSISPANDIVIPKGHITTLAVHCAEPFVPFKKINWQRNSGQGFVSGMNGGITLNAAEKNGDFVYQTWSQLPVGSHTYQMVGTHDDDTTTTYDVVVHVISANPDTQTNLCGTANGVPASQAPTANRCITGANLTSGPVTTDAAFTWTCSNPYTGGASSCRAPRTYEAKFVFSTGTVDGSSTSPKSYQVEYGRTRTVTLVAPPGSGLTPVVTGTCAGVFANGTTGSWTVGPMTSNCQADLSFAAVVNGSCDSNSVAKAWVSAPVQTDALCATGTLRAGSILDKGSTYEWVCDGSGGGTSPTCTASKAYQVAYGKQETNGGTGSISPISPTGASPLIVKAGATATFTIAPGLSTLATVSGCNGGPTTASGSSFTYTAYPTGQCTVTATFNKAGDPGLLGDAHKWDIWIPPGVAYDTGTKQPDLLVVGPMTDGVSLAKQISYLPGCASTVTPGGSGAGCAGRDYYEGVTSDTSTAVKFYLKLGKVLSVRFTSKGPGAAESKFQMYGFDGSTAGNVRIWMTENFAETYAQANARDSRCVGDLAVIVNSARGCAIPAAGKLVYLNMEVLDGAPGKCGVAGQYCRYQVMAPLVYVK